MPTIPVQAATMNSVFASLRLCCHHAIPPRPPVSTAIQSSQTTHFKPHFPPASSIQALYLAT